MNTPVTVGVTTVIYNATRHLKGFVESLLENKESVAFVVFVDNHSSDLFLPYLKPLDGVIRYTVIHNKTNVGYSQAINQGISLLREEGNRYVLVTNNDVTIAPGGIDILVQDMRSADADVVGIPTTNDKESYVLSNRYDTHTGKVHHDIVSQEVLLEKISVSPVEKTMYVQGGVILFRESFFNTIGVYDSFLFFGGDELDFLLRINTYRKPVNCIISLRAWNSFDHHTHHDNRFKFLKAKMMIQGVVYVLLKHGHSATTAIFWNTIVSLCQELGKKSFKRYLVLSFFVVRALIVSHRYLRRQNFI